MASFHMYTHLFPGTLVPLMYLPLCTFHYYGFLYMPKEQVLYFIKCSFSGRWEGTAIVLPSFLVINFRISYYRVTKTSPDMVFPGKLCKELLSLQYYIFTSIHIYSSLISFTAVKYKHPCKKSHAKCSLNCFSFRVCSAKVGAVIKHLSRMTCLFHSWAWPRCYTEMLEETYF